jgi:hypothetical protein
MSQESSLAWDYLLTDPRSEAQNAFLDVLAEVLNGGFEQLWSNKGSDGARYKAKQSIYFIESYAKRYSSKWRSVIYDFIEITEDFEDPNQKEDERRDTKLDELDSKVYKFNDKLIVMLAKNLKKARSKQK